MTAISFDIYASRLSLKLSTPLPAAWPSVFC